MKTIDIDNDGDGVPYFTETDMRPNPQYDKWLKKHLKKILSEADYIKWSDKLSEEAIKAQDDEWERRLKETNDKGENPF